MIPTARASIVVAIGAALGGGGEPAGAGETTPATSLYDLTAKSIDGKPRSLSAWRGKVTLVVNTASQCGGTPQYAGLEVLWRRYKDRGFAILGFPSNDFGGQEPGTEAEIKRFCTLTYKVTFPMFAKIKTRGEGQSPVYRFLTARHPPPEWNFYKYLVDRDGRVVQAFDQGVQPDDPQLRAAVESALAGK